MLRILSSIVLIAALSWWRYPWHKNPEHGFDPDKVLERGIALTSRSWEYGTLVQAMLEFRDASLTVFGLEPFPHSALPIVHDPSTVLGLQYAKSVIWTNDSDSLTDGEGKDLVFPFSDIRWFEVRLQPLRSYEDATHHVTRFSRGPSVFRMCRPLTRYKRSRIFCCSPATS